MNTPVRAVPDFYQIITTEILPLVSKPNRYVGNELGLARKDWDATQVRFLLCYPDAYEVGMSHTGTQILYHVVNRHPEWLLDRVYAPWPDMEEQLRSRGLPLWGLEYKRPVAEYDVLGFTLQSELTYTNLLNVLDLSGLPVRQAERRESDPLVCIGGPCASNPEPLAPFVDFALIGDAEDAIGEVLGLIEEWKRQGRGPGGSRADLLRRLAVEVPGIYVPSLYEVPQGGRMARPKPDAPPGLPAQVVARKVPVLRPEDHPREMVVSLTETTHDRLPIEVMRGCMRGCRFCQAGYLYRPARERDVDEVVEIAEKGIKHSGWQEVSLLSLSTADYSQALELTDRMSRTMVEHGVGVSLPSLRADAFSVGLAEAVSRVRKSGFTFAPEAGSQRLRDVINKGITEEDILSAVDQAMASGWTSVKLYFMIGHPTEGEEDFEELARLVEKIKGILRKYSGRRHITLGFSPFVPKSHTPFQWERQDDFETTRRKLAWIRERLKGQGVAIRHHETADTAIEGIISRGGREIADVIEGAWRRGARFDGWSEHIKYDCWLDSLESCDLTLQDTFREIDEDEELPWEITTYKIDRKYFLKERHKAYEVGLTPECKHERCSACGVCDFDALKNVLAGPVTSETPDRVPGLLQGVPGTSVRLRYGKGENVRFLSHLDLLRELERTFRRAELPMIYTEGFSPRPKLSAGPPLALGWTSDAEWIDVQLAGEWPQARLESLLGSLNACSAAGVDFVLAAAMPPKVTSLVADITTSVYVARFPSPPFDTQLGDLEQAVSAFLAAPSVAIQRVRKGRSKEVDIRPLVHELAVIAYDQVVLTLATGSDGSVKPTEVLQAALGLDESRVPLITIHKVTSTVSSGEEPAAEAVEVVQVKSVEKGNIDYIELTRNACGHSGG
ncbi:MAG: TIGR03960 family B12-binding radical SAM protein [Gemmatimonadetes bacterium]|nr:TIGR03960 family B12-binding radical SAM protein [Gemmatimonadota bacterium]